MVRRDRLVAARVFTLNRDWGRGSWPRTECFSGATSALFPQGEVLRNSAQVVGRRWIVN
jgi:hypothetical protein